MPVFFIEQQAIQGSRVSLGERNTSHLKALRLRTGEELTVSDGMGTEYRCLFRGMENGVGAAEIVERIQNQTEPEIRVGLYVSMPKGDKPELILQKAVELGAYEVCFFLSSRCVSRPDTNAAKKRMERLARVSEEAAMQSGRGRIPQVKWLPGFKEMTESAGEYRLKLFLWENARENALRSVLQSSGSEIASISVITGPEGGFSREEAESAERSGFIPVTLGRRILRCETAPICVLSAIMYETGNLE